MKKKFPFHPMMKKGRRRERECEKKSVDGKAIDLLFIICRNGHQNLRFNTTSLETSVKWIEKYKSFCHHIRTVFIEVFHVFALKRGFTCIVSWLQAVWRVSSILNWIYCLKWDPNHSFDAISGCSFQMEAMSFISSAYDSKNNKLLCRVSNPLSLCQFTNLKVSKHLSTAAPSHFSSIIKQC